MGNGDVHSGATSVSGSYGAARRGEGREDEEASLTKIAKEMWQPLLVSLFYSILQWERTDLTGAFIRSMVSCPFPVPHNGVCPKGSTLVGSTCSATPPGGRHWSGSIYCADEFTAVQIATATGGQLNAIGGVCNLLSIVFVGTTLVDTIGRKPVMLLALFGNSVCCFLFFIAAFPSNVSIALLFLGSILYSFVNSFGIALNAMVADLTPNNLIHRGLAYSAMSLASQSGILLAFVFGFFILMMDLTNYAWVQGILLAVCVVINVASHFLLRETLYSARAREAAPITGGTVEEQPLARHEARGHFSFSRGASELLACFRMVWNDSFLLYLILLSALGQMAGQGALSMTAGYAIYVVGLSQAVASLGGVFQPLAMLAGSAMTPPLVDAVGPYTGFILATLVQSLGMILTGLSSVFPAWAQLLFWAGWIIVGIGWGITSPAYMAIVSIRTRDAGDRGKLFSALGFCNTLGTAVGQIIWSSTMLLKEDSEVHWRSGQGFFLTAAIYIFTVAVYAPLFSFRAERSCEEASPVETRPDAEGRKAQ